MEEPPVSGLVEQKGHWPTEEKHARVAGRGRGRERGRQRAAGRSCSLVEALTQTPRRGGFGEGVGCELCFGLSQFVSPGPRAQ